MKPELTHLLQKLKAEHPDFQNLIISHNGVCMAALRFGYRRFESLDALEQYAWPSQNVGSTDPVAPSAQDARAASALALECGDASPLSTPPATATTINKVCP